MAQVEIEGLDIIDVIDFVTKKRRKFLAILLSELEEVLDHETDEYAQVRKIILDGFNDYTRSVMRALFGDVEGLVQK